MSNIQIFNHSEFGELQIMVIDGKEYFPASECAKILGYANPNDAILRHCKGVAKREGVSLTINQHGTATEQTAEMNFIPEGDLYRLIIRSKLPAAEKFERWVCDEVIPAIRQTGSYAIQPKTQVEIILAQAQALVIQEQRLNAIALQSAATAETVQAIKDTLLPSDKEWRKHINNQLTNIARKRGNDYEGTRAESYQLLEERAKCRLNARLENLKTRMANAAKTRTAIEAANRLDAIEQDVRLKEIYSGIVKEMYIKYAA